MHGLELRIWPFCSDPIQVSDLKSEYELFRFGSGLSFLQVSGSDPGFFWRIQIRIRTFSRESDPVQLKRDPQPGF